MARRARSKNKTIYKNQPITSGEKQVGELVVDNFERGGKEYVTQLRMTMRNLQASKKWSLYYSMERSIKHAMSIIESKNDQWPLALLGE